MLTALLTTLSIFSAFLPLVPSVIVSTKYGKIEGIKAPYPNALGPFKSVSKFLGVPFAAPPTGDLRFKAPQPPKDWTIVRQAKQHGNVCLQPRIFEWIVKLYNPNFKYNEDCLYLDVYTPNISLSLPVLVYIHGGGYEMGTASTYHSDLLALQGVVVVVIQYRLGPFGFLTTGDSAAPGNFGMLDQVEALNWVRDNIENFGGNPNKVTIFGVSAGGSSVSLHLLSPLSKDLFHQAIAESGVDLSPFAIQPTSFGVGFAKELAQKLNCPTSDHSAMVSCLSEKEAADILKASRSNNFQFVDYVQWAPVVDKNFLHDRPLNLRQKGDFKKVPFIISFNSHEGGTYLSLIANHSFGMLQSVDDGVNESYFKTFVAKLARHRNSKTKTADLIADALEFMYTPWPDNSNKYALRSQLVDLIGDYLFVAPSHEVADIHSQGAPVYMYEFAHRPNVSFADAEWQGVIHADNILFDFGAPFSRLLPYSAADRNVSLFIMTMYANFARSGDPTVSGVTWERFNSSHRAYLRVHTNPKMAASFNPRRMAFWNDYHPKLMQVRFDITKEVVSGANASATIAAFLYILIITITGLF